MPSLVWVSVVLAVFGSVASVVANPGQIHLALTNDVSKMAVQWSAPSSNDRVVQSGDPQVVQYGDSQDNLLNVRTASDVLFTDSGDEKYSQTHLIATMENLAPSTAYFYRVGSTDSWSEVFEFTSAPVTGPISSPVTFGIWGDMGASNAQILDYVKEEVDERNFDMILHVGDFAYDMNSDNGHRGDDFMNNIQPLASRVPYMVDAGNHEQAQSFAHYTERFRNMPNNAGGNVTTDNGVAPNNWYYSHDFGNVHFIAINTEVLFVYKQHEHVKKQFEFIENDLKNVDREKTPWIVVHGHRPMYCSCDADCGFPARMTRTGGYVLESKHSLEKLLHKYGVDFYIAGHEHNYERMYDVFDKKTTKSNVNPPATWHIVTGDAGGPEEHESFQRPQPERTAFRTDAYGYSRMTVHNNTHIFWEQVETDTDAGVFGEVVDSVWYVQENHGPF